MRRTALLLVLVRAALAAGSASWWSIGVVEVCEGFDIHPGHRGEGDGGIGHAGAGLGGIIVAYGAGAAVSPALTGLMAQAFGFPAAFVALGTVAALGFELWTLGLRARMGKQHLESWRSRSPNRADR